MAVGPGDGTWDPAAAGVLRLPHGRLVRGRGLRTPLPAGPTPSFGVYLLGREPPSTPWPARWVRWRDFGVPHDRDDAHGVILELHAALGTTRAEVACRGGRGRTGTVLACLAVLDGLTGDDAVAYVRAHYHRHAVETPGQRRYVRTFSA